MLRDGPTPSGRPPRALVAQAPAQAAALGLGRMTLRRRTTLGVTSTHSSSAMNSSACSSEKFITGVRRSNSSAVEERMLFSFFSLVGLTSISSWRAFSPMTMPS
jgi:hypothetical protein